MKKALIAKKTKGPLPLPENIKGEILVHSFNNIKPEFHKPENQLWKATTTFGYNHFVGSWECECVCLHTGEKAVYSKEDFFGTVTQEFANEFLQ